MRKLLRPVRCERGQTLAETAIVLPVLLLILMGIVDLGRAFYLINEVAGAAQAGAVYGSQNPTDTTGMQNAALADAPDVSGMTASASYGCECSDGSNQTPSCSSAPSCASGTTEVNYVQVTTSASYSALLPWPGIPSPLTLSQTAVMRGGQ